MHPWSAPTQAVKAGRRPPEREAVTARSAGAATIDWGSPPGLAPCWPAPPPGSGAATSCRRRPAATTSRSVEELSKPMVQSQLPARPGSAPQSGRDPFHIGIWAGIVSDSETIPPRYGFPGFASLARTRPERAETKDRTSRATIPTQIPDTVGTPPCVQERPATVPQFRPRPGWALPEEPANLTRPPLGTHTRPRTTIPVPAAVWGSDARSRSQAAACG